MAWGIGGGVDALARLAIASEAVLLPCCWRRGRRHCLRAHLLPRLHLFRFVQEEEEKAAFKVHKAGETEAATTMTPREAALEKQLEQLREERRDELRADRAHLFTR